MIAPVESVVVIVVTIFNGIPAKSSSISVAVAQSSLYIDPDAIKIGVVPTRVITGAAPFVILILRTLCVAAFPAASL